MLSRKQDDLSLRLTDVIEGFGYEAVDLGVADGGEGVFMGRWWMALGDEKYCHDCRTATEPLDQLFASQFLDNFKKKKKKRLGLGKKQKRRVCSEYWMQMMRIRMIQNLLRTIQNLLRMIQNLMCTILNLLSVIPNLMCMRMWMNRSGNRVRSNDRQESLGRFPG